MSLNIIPLHYVKRKTTVKNDKFLHEISSLQYDAIITRVFLNNQIVSKWLLVCVCVLFKFDFRPNKKIGGFEF